MLLFLFLWYASHAQERRREVTKAPPRAEGEGPFEKLILRGAILIDGTGAPPFGPTDIVIEKNRITHIRTVGYPGLPLDTAARLKPEGTEKILDVHGKYVLPGFVDMHGHIGGVAQGTPAEYVFKLWLAHGITTIREPGSGNGAEWTLEAKAKSDKNEIAAPRIKAYFGFGLGARSPIRTPEDARKWVQEIKKMGADGIKFFHATPEVLAAALQEAKDVGLGTAMHHSQLGVARANVLFTARNGLTTMEHWYGLPEALFTDRTIQDYPADYNYQDEQHRFGEAGKLWKQAVPPYSEHWNNVMNELLKLDFTINPTFTIYEASRDLMKQYRAEWHEQYTLPSLWRFFAPNRAAHGSFWFYWGTEQEVAWRENYRLWMMFVNEYKNRGGRVTLGSDAGFIYKLYGFGYIQEMELFREAGFHPLEIIRSATLHGAQAIKMADQIGSVEVGKLADLVIVDENPLANFKVLYGTGALKLDEKNKPIRVGGVKYTIKDGIVYDAKKLLEDVRKMVKEAKEKEGFEIKPPGW
jgi:imidazolonepropionase-like amidohydrolase